MSSSCLRLALCGAASLLVACPSTATLDASEPDASAAVDAFAPDAAQADAAADDAPDAVVEMLDAALEVPDASEPDAGMDASFDAAVVAPDAPPSPDAAPDARPSDAGPADAAIMRMTDSVTNPSATPIPPFATCTVTTSTDTISGAEHRTPCTDIAYPFYPPSAGPHYSQWASFNTYSAPIPWGFLVHSMEHGAVILLYNCATASDCDAVRTEYASIITDHGLDPLCRDEDWSSRIIVVPDPTLTVPIAAVAWRNVYQATCLDSTSLRAFVDAHYGMATESLCLPGVDFSASTWCP